MKGLWGTIGAAVTLTLGASALAASDHDSRVGALRRPSVGAIAKSRNSAPLNQLLAGMVSDVYTARIHHLIGKAKDQSQPRELQDAVHRLLGFVGPENRARLEQLAANPTTQDATTLEFLSWVRAESAGRRATSAIASGTPPSQVRRAFIPQHPFQMPNGGSRQLCYQQCSSPDYRGLARLSCHEACDQAR